MKSSFKKDFTGPVYWIITQYCRVPEIFRDFLSTSMLVYTVMTGKAVLLGPFLLLGTIQAAAFYGMRIRWVYANFALAVVGEIFLWKHHIWHW